MATGGVQARRLVLVGCGKMGTAMLRGWLAAGVASRCKRWRHKVRMPLITMAAETPFPEMSATAKPSVSLPMGKKS